MGKLLNQAHNLQTRYDQLRKKATGKKEPTHLYSLSLPSLILETTKYLHPSLVLHTPFLISLS